MKIKNFCTLILLLSTLLVKAQTNPVRINPNIILPGDSSESRLLISSLNDFLIAAQKPKEENNFILETEKTETFILLDAVSGIEKSGKFKDDFFYKPYLTNIVPLKDDQYLLQVSYIGTNDNTSYLRTSFEIIAHKTNSRFLFSSSLLKNVKNWKIEKTGNNVFHYQHTINKKKVKEFNKLTASFDLKLKLKNNITEFYCCDNIIEMQKLVGIGYMADENGRSQSVWSSSLGDKKIILLGNNNSTFNEIDPHDLWHDRLSLVIPRSQVNRPVDEGCAYLYGGSWGISWKDIFKEFKLQIASDTNTNWLEIKENPVSFKTKNYPNAADYIVNALIVKKIEKEKGFAGVWELLNCGKFEKGNDNYFRALQKLTGITKANYNEKVWALIKSEK